MVVGKQVRQVAGACARMGAAVSGYEIHAGVTTGPALARPMLRLDDRANVAVSRTA